MVLDEQDAAGDRRGGGYSRSRCASTRLHAAPGGFEYVSVYVSALPWASVSALSFGEDLSVLCPDRAVP